MRLRDVQMMTLMSFGKAVKEFLCALLSNVSAALRCPAEKEAEGLEDFGAVSVIGRIQDADGVQQVKILFFVCPKAYCDREGKGYEGLFRKLEVVKPLADLDDLPVQWEAEINQEQSGRKSHEGISNADRPWHDKDRQRDADVTPSAAPDVGPSESAQDHEVGDGAVQTGASGGVGDGLDGKIKRVEMKSGLVGKASSATGDQVKDNKRSRSWASLLEGKPSDSGAFKVGVGGIRNRIKKSGLDFVNGELFEVRMCRLDGTAELNEKGRQYLAFEEVVPEQDFW